MKTISLNCKNCGAELEVDIDKKVGFCSFCGAKLLIDDEVIHHRIDNAYEFGYESELGRLNAQKEFAEKKNPVQEENKAAKLGRDLGRKFGAFCRCKIRG